MENNNYPRLRTVLVDLTIDLTKFRDLCERKKWYDANLYQTYEEALKMAEKCHSFGDLILLANHIVEHSYEKSECDPMGCILDDCCRFTVTKYDPPADHLSNKNKIRRFLSRFNKSGHRTTV